jgi:hypothetical protein
MTETNDLDILFHSQQIPQHCPFFFSMDRKGENKQISGSSTT